MDFIRFACRLVVTGAALHLAACTNMSGLGGGSEFQCKAPEGVPCQSISGVHHNDRAGNLPAQRAGLNSGVAKPEAGPSNANSGHSQGIGDRDSTAPDAAEPKAVRLAYRPAYRKAVTSTDAQGADLGAIRSEPTIIRIWVAPWEDADGDLNEQGYVYLQIDSGRWLIEHNRAKIRRDFAPQRATPTPTPLALAVPPVDPAAQRVTATPSSSASAASVAPKPGAKMMTKEEAIALGKLQAQALKDGKAAAATGAEGRP